MATPINLAKGRSTSRSLHRATTAPKREPSQDSFAGDFEDPAEQFIASSKQFGVPLAELGRVASPSVEGSPRKTRRTMYTGDDVPLASLSKEGTVLVPDSDYGNSQSQSQPKSQSQGENDDYNVYDADAHQPEDDLSEILPAMPGSQTSTHYPTSSEPSSTDIGLYGTPPLEILQPTQLVDEPTQIEATQLVDQSPESPVNSNLIQRRGDIYSNVTGTTGGHARTLLDSLNDHKRNRYAIHHGQISRVDHDPAATSGATYSSSVAPPGLLTLQDTQPAFEEAPVSPTRSLGTPQQTTGAASRPRRTRVDDRTEVIPDSEPLREGSVSPSKSPAKSAPKSRQRPASSDTETDTDNPDAMVVDGEEAPGALNAIASRREEEEDDEEEEEEEDIPLSITKSKRAGGKKPDLKGKGKAVEMGPPPVKTKVLFLL